MLKNNKHDDKKFSFSIITFNKRNSFRISKLYIKTENGYETFLCNYTDLITTILPSKGFFKVKEKIFFKINSDSILKIEKGKAELITKNIIIYS